LDDVVPDTSRKMAHLVAQKYAEIYICKDEFNASDGSVQARSTRSVQTHPFACFVTGKQKEADEEHERDEKKNEVCHNN
jgi:hypothetical protein